MIYLTSAFVAYILQKTLQFAFCPAMVNCELTTISSYFHTGIPISAYPFCFLRNVNIFWFVKLKAQFWLSFLGFYLKLWPILHAFTCGIRGY